MFKCKVCDDINKDLHRLLKENRYILIRIPTVSSHAWRHYRENWVQLDAPRHLFLHSVKSLKHLAETNGFELIKVVYDSTEFQFVGSELYLRNIPLKAHCGKNIKNTLFNKDEIDEYRKKAEALNQMNDGDQACFILYKS